jgi:hypothetical protein
MKQMEPSTSRGVAAAYKKTQTMQQFNKVVFGK